MRRALATVVILQLAVMIANAAAAPSSSSRFRFERAVTPTVAGANRLPVDVPMLVGARPLRTAGARIIGGMDDLRFYDSGGREVGYLRIDPAPRADRWEGGVILPVAATEEASGFEVDLGRTLRTDRLRLSGIPAPFLKRFRLEGSGDRAHWTVLVGDGTVFDLPDEYLVRTEIDFVAGEFQYLRVTWNDRSSAVVPPPAKVTVRVVDPGKSAPSTMVPLTLERRSSEPGKSRFRLHLPGAGLPVVALELSTGGGHLLRNAEVSEPRLAGAELVPVPLGSHTLRRAIRGELVAADLSVPIARPEGPELDLVVDDGDNPPLELTAVRAELAPLPWLYFESTGGDTLIARYGDANLGAPQYDLEAVRSSIDESHVAEARWGDVRELKPLSMEPEQQMPEASAAGAAIDLTPFRFTRPIPSGPSGLVALVLDAAVLAHSRDLQDIRIADGDAHQVPYLVERLAEPLAVELPALEAVTGGDRTTDERTSRYRLNFPFESLPASRLVLRTSGRIFTRTVSVLVERPPTDPRSKPRIALIASAAWRHTDPERPAPPLVLQLPRLGVSTAQVRIDEGDNTPLPLSRPELLLPGLRLRFFRPDGGALTLVYGAPDLPAPRYDLQLLAPRVLGASALEAFPATEETTGTTDAKSRETRKQVLVFWGALVLTVLVLVVVIVRLVTGGAPAQGSSGN